jgi:hypothetical protein
VHKQVVGDQGDRHVHDHEHGDPLGRLARVQDVEIRQQQDSVTRMARRKNSQRGAELILVTIGQATHAMITPVTVSLA